MNDDGEYYWFDVFGSINGPEQISRLQELYQQATISDETKICAVGDKNCFPYKTIAASHITITPVKHTGNARTTRDGDLKKCPYCAEKIRKDACCCIHCKEDLTGGHLSGKTSTPGNLVSSHRFERAIVVMVVLAVLFVTNFHIITGKFVGLRITSRNAFGFSEFIINVDAIIGMPRFAAQLNYPIGCKVLQREGIIESDASFERRVKADAQREFDHAQREALNELNRIMNSH